MIRELMLNQMHFYEMPNERAAQAARKFLAEFKLPLRLVTHNQILELGANNLHPIQVALRTLREKGFVIKRRLPWKPPAILHEDNLR